MSRTRHLTRRMTIVALLAGLGSIGCWEQWSENWWPQMKWQKAVQAFEDADFRGQAQFLPPEGTVPIDGGEAVVSNVIDAESDVLVNPRPASLASLENGRVQYMRYCRTCHGNEGLGDGPVSMTGDISGPFGGVLPIAGPASIARVRSDGHIYTTIRYGRRRMPGHTRIASQDRWDIVNYVRYLGGQGVSQ